MADGQHIPEPDEPAAADRRKFLGTAGRFAVVVPPAMTMLLSTTLSSPAVAISGGAPHTHPDVGKEHFTAVLERVEQSEAGPFLKHTGFWDKILALLGLK